MLKRIDRYIIKKFLSTFFFMLGLIMVFSVVFDISEKLERSLRGWFVVLLIGGFIALRYGKYLLIHLIYFYQLCNFVHYNMS